jgi:DtxR family Mn-dependent transcriptional regulator
MPASTLLSRSVEDYLKAIYSLSRDGTHAQTSAIADALGVQPASVTGMVKRLAEDGWLEHVRYRGVRLTPEGSREALRIVRRHRILETYLLERLGYTWDDVHREAERLEHAASDELIERMATALENPSHDPHGAPIPTRAGEIERVDQLTLVEAEPGQSVRIREVGDDDGERLRYMHEVGLKPGVPLAVVKRTTPEGPVTVRVGGHEGREEVLANEVARRIFVTPL